MGGAELQRHKRVASVKKRPWEEGSSAGVSVADGPREEAPQRPKRLMELCPKQKAKGGEKNVFFPSMRRGTPKAQSRFGHPLWSRGLRKRRPFREDQQKGRPM